MLSAPTPPLPEPEARTRPLWSVFLATYFARFAFGITLAVFASYITHKPEGLTQTDVGVVGVVSAMAPIGEFSTVLFSGAAADRFGRFPVLFAGMAAAALLFAVEATTRSPLILGATNLLFGVASGAILASSLALVAGWSGSDEVGYEMGRFDAVNLFGWIGGFAFGFGIEGSVANAELRYVFVAGALVLALGLALAAQLVRGTAVRMSGTRFDFAEIVRHAFRRSVLLVTMPWLVIYLLIGTALVFLGPSANGLGVSSVVLAAAIGGGGTLLVVTQPFFGRLADRAGRTRMMTFGAGGFVAVLVFASLLVAFGPRVPLLVGIGASILAALAYGPAALAALADLTVDVGRATTMAIYSLTISLGMFVGLFGSTVLFDLWGNVGLYVFFGSVALALVLLTAARYRDVRDRRSTGLMTPAR